MTVWTHERIAELKALWPKFGKREVARRMGMTIGQVSGKARILNLHFASAGKPLSLAHNHPAVVRGTSIFGRSVVDPGETYRALKPGTDTTKLGGRVEKGPWRGMPIFSLTLEERASCPRSCVMWRSCYGNSMPFAKRLRHGDDLVAILEFEMRELAARHAHGFVVRLHILGDFYSLTYVGNWAGWLQRFPMLRVFGYTAHSPNSEIGMAIAELRVKAAGRFAIRFSGIETKVIEHG